MIVKICGLVDPDNAAAVAASGADWLGINFWPRSKRWVDRERGRAVAAAARAANPAIVLVGVFVDQLADGITGIAGDVGLDYVQLHGSETAGDCAGIGTRVPVVRAIGLSGPQDLDRLPEFADCAALLVDAPTAGSGQTFDWALARRAVAGGGKVLLAGGLTPDNVGRAVTEVRPYGVDVASGVESGPGIKDLEKVRRFVHAAKGAA